MAAAPSPPPAPGDFLPPIVLKDAAGAVVDLSFQTIAGDPVVLLLGDGVLGTLGASLPDTSPASVFHVVTREPDGPGGPRRLVDPGNRVAEMLGFAEGAAVIDPMSRLAWVWRGPLTAPAAEVAARICRDLVAPRPVELSAPVLLVEGVLDAGLCHRLIGYWDQGDRREGGVASPDGAYGTHDFKRRTDVMLQDPGLHRDVQLRFARRLAPLVNLAYCAEMREFEAMRVGCYEAGDGYFRRHRDNRTPYTNHRSFAISLLLNDEYEGGDLVFPEFGRRAYRAPAGSAIVFSCNLLHEVTPVTAGRRFVLVSFLFNAEGQRKVAARKGHPAPAAPASGGQTPLAAPFARPPGGR